VEETWNKPRGKEDKNIAKTAAARHLLTAFYAMRDSLVRSLAARAAAQTPHEQPRLVSLLPAARRD
jgi:uncharacterized protein (DUF2267 family)